MPTPMLVYLNGAFVPPTQAMVSIDDRGFRYGDGLFETIRVACGRLVLWTEHLQRFETGRQRLGIALPSGVEPLRQTAVELVRRNELSEGVLRIQLSRGIGARGYSTRGADQPTLVLTTHPLPPLDGTDRVRWRLHTASIRLPFGDELAAYKTCNRLIHVLARAEAEAAGADEALLLDRAGFAVEAASANLFWIEDGEVLTPPLSAGIVAGITRAKVIDLCAARSIALHETSVPAPHLWGAEGVFITLSSYGIIEIASLDGQALARSAVTRELYQAYLTSVRTECR